MYPSVQIIWLSMPKVVNAKCKQPKAAHAVGWFHTVRRAQASTCQGPAKMCLQLWSTVLWCGIQCSAGPPSCCVAYNAALVHRPVVCHTIHTIHMRHSMKQIAWLHIQWECHDHPCILCPQC